MPSADKQSSKMANGSRNGLNAGNLNQVGDARNGSSVDRFSQSSLADEPYFARARMQDRSAHVSRLTSQLTATDEILKK